MTKKSDRESVDNGKKYAGWDDCATGCGCCFWKSSCHLCCGFLPPINQSTGTKIMYSLYLLLFTAFATLINSGGFTSWLTQMEVWKSFCCSIDNSTNNNCTLSDQSDTIDQCKELLGATGVYLVYLTVSIFFVTMAMLTANLRHSHQFRATLHNGFWIWKFVSIGGLFVGLYIAIAFNGTSEYFLEIWKWTALVFGTVFIFWQMTVFINFAYEWGRSWAQAAHRSPSKTGTCCWFFAIWFFSFILILATTGAYVVLYYGFTQSPSGVTSGACTVNKWFVIGAGAACALVLVMAIIPCGDRTTTRSPTTGILQASLVSAYIMYLTFSAINAQSPVTVPLENRVQGYENVTDCVERCFHLPQQFVGWLDRVNDTQVDDLIATINQPCPATSESSNQLTVIFNYVAIGLTLFLIIKSAMNSSAITAASDSETRPMFCCCYSWHFPKLDAMDMRGQDIVEDDYERLSYRYWSFHLIYAAASMYLMMTITNWFTPSATLEDSFKSGNSTTFWIKAGTTVAIVVIYIGALMAPLFCPKSWFSHQLDGKAGLVDDNSIRVKEDIEVDSSEEQDQNHPDNTVQL